MNWNDFFDYKDGSLYWKVKTSTKIKIGSLVGSVRPDGYVTVKVNGKSHYVHRIVWLMFNANISDGMTIDHINHVRSDNRIENLRCVSMQENHKNRSKPKNNSSGFCGVTFDKNSGKWQSRLNIGGKRFYLGLFDSAIDASIARELKARELKFHENHGV